MASPGPDFALVLRQSVSRGARAGRWTAAGIGTGILVHVAYCLLGVAVVLARSPGWFAVMGWVAAAYLAWLGVSALRAARHGPTLGQTDTSVPPLSAGRLWLAGFLTNGLNPKATLFFLALFTVVIDPATPLWIQTLYGGYLALATFLWFALLAGLLGLPVVRDRLLASGAWFERAMGVVLIGLALRLVLGGIPG